MKHLPKQTQHPSIKLSFKKAIRKVSPKVKLDGRKKYSEKLLIKLYITKRNGQNMYKNTRKRAREEEEVFSPRKRFKSSRDKQKGRAQRYSPEVVVIDNSSEDAEDEYESDSGEEEEEVNSKNEDDNSRNEQKAHSQDKEGEASREDDKGEANREDDKEEASREDDDDDKTVVGEIDEESSDEEEWFFQERRTDGYTDDEEQFYRERGTDEYTDDDWAYDPRYQYGELVTLYTMSPSQNN